MSDKTERCKCGRGLRRATADRYEKPAMVCVECSCLPAFCKCSDVHAKRMCESCEETPAELRFTACNMDGTILHDQALCRACANYTPQFGHTVTVEFNVGTPANWA
jgi:hypothetical protein